MRLSQEHLVVMREKKIFPFVKFEVFFITPPYRLALHGVKFYDKFVDRFQDISKVKNQCCQQDKSLAIT